jgi:hypothetical protein
VDYQSQNTIFNLQFISACAKCQEAVRGCDTNLELCNLFLRLPHHQALAQQLHAVHLGFGATSAMVAASLLPDLPAQSFRRAQRLVSSNGARAAWLSKFGSLRSGMPARAALSAIASRHLRMA